MNTLISNALVVIATITRNAKPDSFKISNPALSGSQESYTEFAYQATFHINIQIQMQINVKMSLFIRNVIWGK